LHGIGVGLVNRPRGAPSVGTPGRFAQGREILGAESDRIVPTFHSFVPSLPQSLPDAVGAKLLLENERKRR
jgi:hypothetical protein